MNTRTNGTTELLANEFATVLREWLSPDEFATMRETNARYARDGITYSDGSHGTADGVCASHDYCDANVAMGEAFERIVGRESVMPSEGPQGEHDQALWNSAWALAKARHLTAPDTSIALHNRAMRHLINAAAACGRATTHNGHAAALRAYNVAMAHAKALVR